MNENFLQFIWENNLFEKEGLIADTGEKVEIIKTGHKNNDAGPDFFNAQINIGNQVWAGNVEIHIKASDWYQHKHNKDVAYNSVVLHAVNYNNLKTYRTTGEQIPTIELTYNQKLLHNYLELCKSNNKIACFSKIKYVDKFAIKHWLSRLQIERLEQKSKIIEQLLNQNKNNWEETFYQYIAKNFGFKKNAVPFEMLSKSLPLKYLSKHKNNLLQIEAMLFGQAGMLNENYDNGYYKTLKNEYKFLKTKFDLKPIDSHLWKFLRLRPSNFPTIRIAQFAQLIYKSSKLFSKILENKEVTEIRNLFTITASKAWDYHYVFDKESKKRVKNLGKSAIDNILINTVSLFLFVYGMKKSNESYQNRALELLENIKPENNAIIRNWKEIDINIDNAFYSQSLIQLNNEYCIKQRCLHCQIGNKLVRNLQI